MEYFEDVKPTVALSTSPAKLDVVKTTKKAKINKDYVDIFPDFGFADDTMHSDMPDAAYSVDSNDFFPNDKTEHAAKVNKRKLTNQDKATFICELCGHPSHSHGQYRYHFEANHSSTVYECDICGKW